jgi:hypothetical protein
MTLFSLERIFRLIDLHGFSWLTTTLQIKMSFIRKQQIRLDGIEKPRRIGVFIHQHKTTKEAVLANKGKIFGL